jgi:NTP pyrophosphatase (non-canonical NTP hydrolase)
MEKVLEVVRRFREERDWGQFHTPENLAKSISIEAGELLEHFQWNNTYDKEATAEELADVLVYCIHMADAIDVNIEDIILKKMEKNARKYPIEKAKGTSKKYTEL